MENVLKSRIITGQKNILNDDMVTVISLKSKYVSEGVGEDYRNWNPYNPVFISAQTGMGKNTFIEDIVIRVINQLGWKILIVSNRIANSRQQKERIADLKGCKQYLEKFTDKGLDDLEDFKNVRVLTYHKLGSDLNNLWKQNELKQYSMVIFDECHFFMSDSLFNNNTGRILKKSLSTFKNSIRIYMTATDDEILPVIAEEEKRLWSKTFEALCSTSWLTRPKEFLYYYFKRNYDYINAKYLNSKTEILEEIKKDKSEDKWLIFVSSKDDGKYFVEQIGNNAVFITAQSKDSEESDRDVYREIIKKEKFSGKVLVTTSALDNGVNFKDSMLKNIVIFTHDKTEFLQMLGRKRRMNEEKINLYICARDVAYFNRKLRTVNSKIEAICCYKNNYSLFVDKYFLGDDIYKYELVKQLFYRDEQLGLQLNYLAEKKLYSDKIFIEKMISKLKAGSKEAFIIEQLSWMGLQKTYRLDLWASYIDSNEKIAAFKKFLNDNCEISLSPEKFEAFGERFKELTNMAYGKQPGDRPDRYYKETKMRSIFKTYNLAFDIEKKGEVYTLRKTCKK